MTTEEQEKTSEYIYVQVAISRRQREALRQLHKTGSTSYAIERAIEAYIQMKGLFELLHNRKDQ